MAKAMSKIEEKLPAYIKADSNRGSENVGQDDLQLPRLDLLQALSPQIDKKKEEYIEGAESGMLFNTLTNELYGEEIVITPVYFQKRFLVWVDRKKDSSGGLQGVFDTETEAVDFVEGHENEDKLEIVPTAEHLVLLNDGTEIILSLAKSKMKVSRKFNSLVQLYGGDRFSRSYMLSSIGDESAKGEFQNMKIEKLGFPAEDIYLKAETLYEAVKKGGKKATGDYSNATSAEPEVDSEF